MNVEQAVFASSDRGSVKGYQLIARSPGIDRLCSQQLCRWAPTQMLSDDTSKWTINYFPVSDDLVAITRTVLGGPEYSSRGGTQVVTLILVLRDEQFRSYSCNPIAVARTAMTLGWLRLPLDMTCQHLDPVSLPSRPIEDHGDELGDGHDQLLDEVTALVNEAQRVAVIGLDDPLDAVGRLIPRLAVETRRECSFTTGLTPAVRRPFQAHFLAAADAAMQRSLDSQNIICVKAD
jgi:hypothetical protein